MRTIEELLLSRRSTVLDGKFIIMYSGNIGLYYDLENLMKVVALKREELLSPP